MPRKLKCATELPSNENYEDLPALPKYIDKWLSDVVSPERQPDVYDATVDYILGLMLEWSEDGSRTFEAYAPYVVGFVDGHTGEAQPIGSLRLPDAAAQPAQPGPDATPKLVLAQYKRPVFRSLLPEN